MKDQTQRYKRLRERLTKKHLDNPEELILNDQKSDTFVHEFREVFSSMDPSSISPLILNYENLRKKYLDNPEGLILNDQKSGAFVREFKELFSKNYPGRVLSFKLLNDMTKDHFQLGEHLVSKCFPDSKVFISYIWRDDNFLGLEISLQWIAFAWLWRHWFDHKPINFYELMNWNKTWKFFNKKGFWIVESQPGKDTLLRKIPYTNLKSASEILEKWNPGWSSINRTEYVVLENKNSQVVEFREPSIFNSIPEGINAEESDHCRFLLDLRNSLLEPADNPYRPWLWLLTWYKKTLKSHPEAARDMIIFLNMLLQNYSFNQSAGHLAWYIISTLSLNPRQMEGADLKAAQFSLEKIYKQHPLQLFDPRLPAEILEHAAWVSLLPDLTTLKVQPKAALESKSQSQTIISNIDRILRSLHALLQLPLKTEIDASSGLWKDHLKFLLGLFNPNFFVDNPEENLPSIDSITGKICFQLIPRVIEHFFKTYWQIQEQLQSIQSLPNQNHSLLKTLHEILEANLLKLKQSANSQISRLLTHEPDKSIESDLLQSDWIRKQETHIQSIFSSQMLHWPPEGTDKAISHLLDQLSIQDPLQPFDPLPPTLLQQAAIISLQPCLTHLYPTAQLETLLSHMNTILRSFHALAQLPLTSEKELKSLLKLFNPNFFTPHKSLPSIDSLLGKICFQLIPRIIENYFQAYKQLQEHRQSLDKQRNQQDHPLFQEMLSLLEQHCLELKQLINTEIRKLLLIQPYQATECNPSWFKEQETRIQKSLLRHVLHWPAKILEFQEQRLYNTLTAEEKAHTDQSIGHKKPRMNAIVTIRQGTEDIKKLTEQCLEDKIQLPQYKLGVQRVFQKLEPQSLQHHHNAWTIIGRVLANFLIVLTFGAFRHCIKDSIRNKNGPYSTGWKSCFFSLNTRHTLPIQYGKNEFKL